METQRKQLLFGSHSSGAVTPALVLQGGGRLTGGVTEHPAPLEPGQGRPSSPVPLGFSKLKCHSVRLSPRSPATLSHFSHQEKFSKPSLAAQADTDRHGELPATSPPSHFRLRWECIPSSTASWSPSVRNHGELRLGSCAWELRLGPVSLTPGPRLLNVDGVRATLFGLRTMSSAPPQRSEGPAP